MLKFRYAKPNFVKKIDSSKVKDVRERAKEIFDDIGGGNKDGVKNSSLWKAVIAEMFGTLVLVMFGCGSWIETDKDEHPLTVRIAITFGLTYAVMLYNLRTVSGGHINPVLTIAMVVVKRINLLRAAFYCVAQFTGACIGAGFLRLLTPAPYRDSLGTTNVANELSAEQGFAVELFISFFYVFVVFSCYEKVDQTESTVHKLFSPFIIGMAVIVIHLFAVS